VCEQIAPALDTALKYAVKTVSNPFTLPLWIPTPANQAFNQAKSTLDTLIYGLIQHRRSNPVQYQDLLNMLLNAEGNESGEKMSDQQIRDEVITIFTAGHETTANVLTWTLYLLAQHPAVLAKVQQELQEVLAGNIADTQTLPQLVYTRAVLDESMRIRPPVGIMMRRVSKDTEIGGYRLKAGSLAIINIYNIHHHAQLWQQPKQFKPERFLNESKRSKFSHLPFGIGSRMCVGNQFALFESQLLLSMILQRYQLQLLNQEDVDMEMNVGSTQNSEEIPR